MICVRDPGGYQSGEERHNVVGKLKLVTNNDTGTVNLGRSLLLLFLHLLH